MKRFNMVRFTTQRKRKRFEHLTRELTRYKEEQQMPKDLNTASIAQKVRDMENRYEKLMLKSSECEFIQQTYQQIYDRLNEEGLRAISVLDEFEVDIRRCRAEKKELITIHREATSGKEQTLVELQRIEEFIYADQKRRDIELMRIRKIFEETIERVDRKPLVSSFCFQACKVYLIIYIECVKLWIIMI